MRVIRLSVFICCAQPRVGHHESPESGGEHDHLSATRFYYDSDGQRVLRENPDGSKIASQIAHRAASSGKPIESKMRDYGVFLIPYATT